MNCGKMPCVGEPYCDPIAHERDELLNRRARDTALGFAIQADRDAALARVRVLEATDSAELVAVKVFADEQLARAERAEARAELAEILVEANKRDDSILVAERDAALARVKELENLNHAGPESEWFPTGLMAKRQARVAELEKLIAKMGADNFSSELRASQHWGEELKAKRRIAELEAVIDTCGKQAKSDEKRIAELESDRGIVWEGTTGGPQPMLVMHAPAEVLALKARVAVLEGALRKVPTLDAHTQSAMVKDHIRTALGERRASSKHQADRAEKADPGGVRVRGSWIVEANMEQMAWAGAAILTFLENSQLENTDWADVRSRLQRGLPTFDAARKVVADRDAALARVAHLEKDAPYLTGKERELRARVAELEGALRQCLRAMEKQGLDEGYPIVVEQARAVLAKGKP